MRRKIAQMNFESVKELNDFLSNHDEIELLYKKRRKLLIIETEKTDKEEYRDVIAVELGSKNDKIIISTLERYKYLSDNAKKIIDCVEFPDGNIIELQIGKTFNDIYIDERLYYEVFYFAVDNGLGYSRPIRDKGDEVIKIYLVKDSIMYLE